jgi:hypothetical protein
MGFKGEFRQWETYCESELIMAAYRDPISDVPERIPQLETACLTEENTLSARKHDLFSVL